MNDEIEKLKKELEIMTIEMDKNNKIIEQLE